MEEVVNYKKVAIKKQSLFHLLSCNTQFILMPEPVVFHVMGHTLPHIGIPLLKDMGILGTFWGISKNWNTSMHALRADA